MTEISQNLLDLFAGQPYKLILGDCRQVLKTIPASSVSTCMTSPPYWMQRDYAGNSTLGHEPSVQQYVSNLVHLFREIKRVLRRDGSFWLNIGDTYDSKNLCGIPWRVALAMQEDGWLLRQAVIWDKMKGNPSNAKDKLRNMYEHVFHFVRESNYYYDLDAVRNPPGKAYSRNGRIVTPTGVSGVKYRQQILASRALSDSEKQAALSALEETLRKVETGKTPDFRMIIRGAQRATHSDSPAFSGRATELKKRGFYILPYHQNGSSPGDIWRIIPEDRQRRDPHFAVFPKELCVIPIKTTCAVGGVVLDPLAGTGTSLVAALELGRRAIGIEISEEYLDIAKKRIEQLLVNGPLPLYGAVCPDEPEQTARVLRTVGGAKR